MHCCCSGMPCFRRLQTNTLKLYMHIFPFYFIYLYLLRLKNKKPAVLCGSKLRLSGCWRGTYQHWPSICRWILFSGSCLQKEKCHARMFVQSPPQSYSCAHPVGISTTSMHCTTFPRPATVITSILNTNIATDLVVASSVYS